MSIVQSTLETGVNLHASSAPEVGEFVSGAGAALTVRPYFQATLGEDSRDLELSVIHKAANGDELGYQPFFGFGLVPNTGGTATVLPKIDYGNVTAGFWGPAVPLTNGQKACVRASSTSEADEGADVRVTWFTV